MTSALKYYSSYCVDSRPRKGKDGSRETNEKAVGMESERTGFVDGSGEDCETKYEIQDRSTILRFEQLEESSCY